MFFEETIFLVLNESQFNNNFKLNESQFYDNY